MSDLLVLPRTTYRPPSPQGRRRMVQRLNPIMEEPEDASDSSVGQRRRRQSPEKIRQWPSPMSDHFPTPRGQHFLAAPVLPATPSCMSSDAEPEHEHDVDNDGCSSQASSSIPSFRCKQPDTDANRESIMTDVTEFDDLYDVSEDELTQTQRLQSDAISNEPSSARLGRESRESLGQQRFLPPLVIPEGRTPVTARKLTSPVPPTPPSAVTMSPAVKSLMQLHQAQEIPRVSAPPSLDGSINSEEMAQMSAPPTPLIGANGDQDEEWTGVHLQPGALETLQALAGDDAEYEEEAAQVIEVPQEMTEARRRLPPLVTTGAGVHRAPSFRHSLDGLTRLDIPSPGGFFQELSSASRRTWSIKLEDINPPTSTTAENFYKAPWTNSSERAPAPSAPPPQRPLHLDDHPSAIVERIIELPPKDDSEDPVTAIRVQPTPTVVPTPRQAEAPSSGAAAEEPSSPVDVVEIIDEYGSDCLAKREEGALSYIDRTEMWLAAQRAYLQGVAGFSEEREASEEEEEEEEEQEESEPESGSPVKPEEPAVVASPEAGPRAEPGKKSVRFSEVVSRMDIPCSLPSQMARQESSYYRAFTEYSVRACPADVFVHRHTRFEALQAQRACLRDAHRNQLLGKFQLSVVPQSAQKRMSANVVRGDDEIVDDPEKLRAEKEAEALSQMRMAVWHVAAVKLLNGGRLVAAPVGKRLARQSYTAARPDGTGRDRVRILDLGGQGTCDWAWHAALMYPNAKVYTVTTKAIRQLSNSNIRGPPNHRRVAVTSLARLPFADNQFDLISARELHAVLKLAGEHGVDEWDACLRECMRVLKPGGYLEFNLLDADIMNAGPLGNAKAVEFHYVLRTLGYDPNPTRSFLGRLHAAGFDEIRRAWVCLPVGPKHPPRSVYTAAPGSPAVSPSSSPSSSSSSSASSPRVHRLEAMVTGSTDNIAAVTGIAAGWSWERWLLRAETERAAGELRLADTVTPGRAMREAGKMIADVHSVMEEGRKIGSCFRMLKGYARKPGPRPESTATPATTARAGKRPRMEQAADLGFLDRERFHPHLLGHSVSEVNGHTCMCMAIRALLKVSETIKVDTARRGRPYSIA
ncbi:hypothetical protein VTH06DRAFT_2721 [Thermothelomyces fergusii]